jgi:hypothetical protein
MFAFGTSERAHADLMLYGILNAACDASRGNPPSERDINQVLAAVAGIGAKDEIERMLATQMVATHTAIITTLRRQKQSETLLDLGLGERVLALATGKTRQELYAACPNDRPNHVGIAAQRHIRAGRIQERDGKLYATPTATEQAHATA